jgi:hypothetical protein
MSYDFKLAMSTVVTADVAEEIIKSVIETQTGKTVDRICCRYADGKFDGYDVFFTTESVGKRAVPVGTVDKKFKITEWN